MSIKAVVKDWLPPAILRPIQKWRRARWRARNPEPVELPEWEYVPLGWEANQEPIRGWNQPGVADTYAARWERFRALIAGTAPLAVSHEGIGAPLADDVDAHNQVMTLAYVVGRTALRRDHLTIFDYGGALGHHFTYLKALYPDLALDYSCCELPYVAAQGRRLNPEVKYYIDDSWRAHKFDLVLASNSLQYARRWDERLAELAAAGESTVFITKLPVVQKVPSFVVLQRAEPHGYRTEYLGWCLNEAEFLAAASRVPLVLERKFLVGHWEPYVANAPEKLRHKGFLFRPGN
jgi:putative methyltransferase (TIGR04325 family)